GDEAAGSDERVEVAGESSVGISGDRDLRQHELDRGPQPQQPADDEQPGQFLRRAAGPLMLARSRPVEAGKLGVEQVELVVAVLGLGARVRADLRVLDLTGGAGSRHESSLLTRAAGTGGPSAVCDLQPAEGATGNGSHAPMSTSASVPMTIRRKSSALPVWR